MSENFLWTTYGVADVGTDWDLAAIPSYNGGHFAAERRHLRDPQGHQEPRRGVRRVDGTCSTTRPTSCSSSTAACREAYRRTLFETLGQSEGFPDEVDWQVAKDSLEYADNPNFEALMPKYNETLDILVAYRSKWADTAGPRHGR